MGLRGSKGGSKANGAFPRVRKESSKSRGQVAFFKALPTIPFEADAYAKEASEDKANIAATSLCQPLLLYLTYARSRFIDF